MYFRGKFCEILTSDSREIGVFQESYSAFNRNFFTYYACAAFNWILSLKTKKNLKIAGFFASIPFLTYPCNKRLKLSILVVQLRRKIALFILL